MSCLHSWLQCLRQTGRIQRVIHAGPIHSWPCANHHPKTTARAAPGDDLSLCRRASTMVMGLSPAAASNPTAPGSVAGACRGQPPAVPGPWCPVAGSRCHIGTFPCCHHLEIPLSRKSFNWLLPTSILSIDPSQDGLCHQSHLS